MAMDPEEMAGAIVDAIGMALEKPIARIAALEAKFAALAVQSREIRVVHQPGDNHGTRETALELRLATVEKCLEEVKARPQFRDGGVWKAGTVYEAGMLVTHRGSSWICGKTHLAAGHDLNHDCFRLAVKKGRDGRDRAITDAGQ